MKVKENVTVYICEHCKKKMFRKHAMEHHEKWCASNPDNWKACIGCNNLEETQIETYYMTPYGEREQMRKGFRCKVLDKLLYPLVVERRGLNLKYDTFDDQEPMPKECEHRFDNALSDLPF